jgi:hypothetical protein
MLIYDAIVRTLRRLAGMLDNPRTNKNKRVREL